MIRDSFVFYKSFYDAIKNIPKEDQLEVYNAICEYSFSGNIPETLTGVAKAMFILMKPNIDNANARYKASVENGKKGGRPKKIKTQEKPNNNLDKTQEEPNGNLNDNYNDNYNVDDYYNYNVNKDDNKKISFGEYKRIKLTQKQYNNLCDEFNKDFIDNQIMLLDEYVQSNNNKNKYKDFNIVIRKSIRENWFNKGGNNNKNYKESVKIRDGSEYSMYD